MSSADLTPEDIAWVKSYADAVERTFSAEFATAADRFNDGQVLLDRFKAAIDTVLKNGRGYFRAVDEAHNELCVASALLANTKLRFIRLEYEPPLSGCARTIDFRATADNGQVAYVDVKTIKPEDTDRWDQFERANAERWLPDNIIVGIAEQWLGGEIWHGWFAARGRMLEYARELEQKISDAGLAADNVITVLALCGDGLRWHQDQLEDFVAFYSTGAYRADDTFSQVEQKYMTDKSIFLKRNISRFAYFQRKQGEIRANRVNWNVRPPRDPFF
ncbi:MAG TPA: hypothetical protein VFK06_17960 [Candidatus Angelobacter sp.]|nr:hypothetical protein [Candidatus Angelobacter sp.]